MCAGAARDLQDVLLLFNLSIVYKRKDKKF